MKTPKFPFEHCSKPLKKQRAYFLLSDDEHSKDYQYQALCAAKCPNCPMMLLGWYGYDRNGNYSEPFAISLDESKAWAARLRTEPYFKKPPEKLQTTGEHGGVSQYTLNCALMNPDDLLRKYPSLREKTA